MKTPNEVKWIRAETSYEVGRTAMVALLKEERYLKLTLEALPNIQV